MSVAIIPPNPYFPYTDKGKPVYNGALYIGESGKNPKQYPIQVNAIDSQNVATALPLGVDTPCIYTGSGGVPLYNGIPVRLVVDGDYSILLEDSNEVQIYYSQSETGSYQGDGQTVIDDFEALAAQALRNAGGVPLDDGQWGIGKTYTAYDQYLYFNGVPYKPLSIPYLTQGADPTSGVDVGNVQPWQNISELQSIARSLNIFDGRVIYSTDTTTVLDNMLYIFDAVTTWSIPTLDSTGKTVVSVVDGTLTTTGGTGSNTYKLSFVATENRESNLKNYGAVVNTDITAVLTDMIAAGVERITVSEYYDLSSITIPASITLIFDGGRFTALDGATVNLECKITADDEDWIFDCEATVDQVTNYSNDNTLVYTQTPFLFGQTVVDTLESGLSKKVSVKWFGATGTGMKLADIGDYFTTVVLPLTEYVDDTKALRMAFVAVSREYPSGSIVGSSAGPFVLYFPAGQYCVNKPIYISGGTSFIGDSPTRPNRSTGLLQVNADQDLLVLQSRGTGGLGGGSAHVGKDLTIGYRACSVSTYKNTIVFEDNKFNLDSSFHNIRFSNCSTHGSVFRVDKKEARLNGENGYQAYSGLEVSMHLYDCMFDVCQGVAFSTGPSGTFNAEIVNCQFFDIRDGLIRDDAKDAQAPPIRSKYRINGGEVHGGGSPNSSIADDRNLILGNDETAEYRFNNAGLLTLPQNSQGGPMAITTCKVLSIVDCHYVNSNTTSLSKLLKISGKIGKFIFKGNEVESNAIGPTSILEFESGFYADTFVMKGNTFNINTSDPTAGTIFILNPSTAITNMGALSYNEFYGGGTQAIIGNPNPNMTLEGNFFEITQDLKGVGGANSGMKGRSHHFTLGVPTGGYRGDTADEEQPVAGGHKGYVCVSDGVWKAYGAIEV